MTDSASTVPRGNTGENRQMDAFMFWDNAIIRKPTVRRRNINMGFLRTEVERLHLQSAKTITTVVDPILNTLVWTPKRRYNVDLAHSNRPHFIPPSLGPKKAV